MTKLMGMVVRARLAASALVLALAVPATATDGSFSASIAIRPARGKLDETTQKGTLKIRNWRLRVENASDGLDPANEPIILSIGSGEKETEFRVPFGALEVSRNGKRFRYRADTDDGIQRLTLKRRKDGTWKVGAKLAGILMERLSIQTSVCEFLSLEIGNDEAFIGINMRRPKPSSSKVKLVGFCEPDVCLGQVRSAATIGDDTTRVSARHGVCPT